VAVSLGGKAVRVAVPGVFCCTWSLAGAVDGQRYSVRGGGKGALVVTLYKKSSASADTWSEVDASPPVASSPPPVKAGPVTESSAAPAVAAAAAAPVKDWASLVADVEKEEQEVMRTAGGDVALQALFRSIYEKADEDTRRAMAKSYVESGGTCLSTDWRDVGSRHVEVTPPDGMEARKF
jgi:suppressor of G2 allele of SKP1